MESIGMFVAWFLLWALATGTFILFVGLVAFWLAKKRKRFFALTPEGKVIVAVSGKKPIKYIGKIRDFYVDPDSGEIIEEANLTPKQKNKMENPGMVSEVLEYFGLSWIGIWPFVSIYEYDFKWNDWTKKDNGSDFQMIPRHEKTSYLYFRHPYPFEFKAIETKGKVPLDIVVLVTIRTTDVNKVLFKTGGEWLSNVSGSVLAVVRDFVGQLELEDITTMQHESENSDFIEAIKNLNDSSKGNVGLPEVFGVEIEMANLMSIEISGPDKQKLREASTKKYVASQEAEGNRVKALGDADVTKTKAGADAFATEVRARAEAEATKVKAEAKATEKSLLGSAAAEAAKKLTDAIGDHPSVAMARAIRETKVKTLILGNGVLPTLSIDEKE